MSDSLRNNGVTPFANSYLAAFKSSNSQSQPYRLDEGYSEDTESRADSRMGDNIEPQGQPLIAEYLQNLNNNLSEAERIELIYEILGGLRNTDIAEVHYSLLNSLPTSQVATIVDRLKPRLHIDPVLYLPPEITFDIFSYLNPKELLDASKFSKSWRSRTMDNRLWRKAFGAEGWNPNRRNVKDYEEEQRLRVRRSAERKSRVRSSEAVSDAESNSPKKRVREGQLFGESTSESRALSKRPVSPLQWAAQHDTVEADDDEKMEDAPFVPAEIPTSPLDQPIQDNDVDPPITPSLILSPRTSPTVNWAYLYKQKRRLEENWEAGRFKNFQLPHPSHPEEAHAECVYTIQYSGSHLVSGSRDKTLRIWNLNTQRLAVKPLRGHDASVLCLQFDASPDQDIVVSGGSDCHVILWRFSTGALIKKMAHAHSESVLNLRFNDTYLITCSKDKTIKIWNRQELLPADSAYPLRGHSKNVEFPAYILNIDNLLESDMLNTKPLKEYTLLMTLKGHGAAVNAIQILDRQIVSASGDRHVKVWDVKTGLCLKTMTGHLKGIACVQFDGRRIVSGSSDETVRIFCRSTGAEVACLKGHKSLVRTVQARFCDPPGASEDDKKEARAIDAEFLRAKSSGALPTRGLTREQRHARNAGSKNVEDIFAIGAELPPGGGGSKWARIVSGSYDESVIIWKREKGGNWVIAHKFLQLDAVVNAGGRPRILPQAHGHHHIGHANQGHAHPVLIPQPPTAGTGPGSTAQPANANAGPVIPGMSQAQILAALNSVISNNAPTTPTTPAPSSATTAGPSNTATSTATSMSSSNTTSNTTTVTNTTQAPQAMQAPITQGSLQQAMTTAFAHSQHPLSITLPNGQTLAQAIQGFPPHLQQAAAQNLIAHAMSNVAGLPHHLQQAATQNLITHAMGNAVGLPHHPHAAGTTQINAVPNVGGNLVATAPAHQAQGVAQVHAHPIQTPIHPPVAPGAGTGTNSRVFKLQFDSRRIICCSQDPTIVGWDFANGDAEIESVGAFFGEDY